MKTFLKWTEEKHLDLPLLHEKTARSGIAWWMYSSGVVRHQYPDLWFASAAADHGVKMLKQPNDKAPADTAAK